VERRTLRRRHGDANAETSDNCRSDRLAPPAGTARRRSLTVAKSDALI
jgi:hypothetical protein